jgi:hypothetical protein
MDAARWPVMSGLVAATGALCWLVKLSVIVATGGEVIDTGAAAVFYLLGTGLLLLGGLLIGLWLTAGRGTLLRIAGGILGLVVFLISFLILDAIGQAVVGQRGPDYAAQESGIFLTAICWLTIGLWVSLRRGQLAELATSSQ